MSPTFHIPVDASNPGQFFACCGLFEVAARLHPRALSWFDQHGFLIEGCPPATTPDDLILCLLGAPELAASMTKQSALGSNSSKILPLTLTFGESTLRLDWWRDEARRPAGEGTAESCAPSVLKTWAGQQSPQQILYDGVLAALRKIVSASSKDLFWARAPMTGRFGLEPTAASVALEVGWSPDSLNVAVASAPAIELLAAIGLQRFRPEVVVQTRRECRYRTWSTPLPLSSAPAASAGVLPGLPTRAFRFRIAQRGDYKFFARAEPEGDSRE